MLQKFSNEDRWEAQNINYSLYDQKIDINLFDENQNLQRLKQNNFEDYLNETIIQWMKNGSQQKKYEYISLVKIRFSELDLQNKGIKQILE